MVKSGALWVWVDLNSRALLGALIPAFLTVVSYLTSLGFHGLRLGHKIDLLTSGG